MIGKLLTESEVAQITGRAIQTLRNDRFKSQGIPYIKLGRNVRYDPKDVEEHILQNKIEFTS